MSQLVRITRQEYELVHACGLVAYYSRHGVLVKVAECNDAAEMGEFLRRVLEHARTKLSDSRVTYVYYHIFGKNRNLRNFLKWAIRRMGDPKVQYRKFARKAKLYVYK